jgi:pimeloyl-ACP methyl ester carboxylesterase
MNDGEPVDAIRSKHDDIGLPIRSERMLAMDHEHRSDNPWKEKKRGMGISRRKFIATLGAATEMIVPEKHLMSANPASRSLPALVFIHGIKGSILTDAQRNVRWLTVWQALGLTSSELKLPLQWQGDVQQRDGLIASAPLGSVGWHAVYAPFLEWASASGRTLRSFAYDWRRDNLENTEAFITFVEGVRRESGIARVQVVSHSMGGLITFVAMNRRPDLFQSVLFAGVPFGSSISFLEDLHSGTSNGFNQRILNPQVLFTFASPYTLLPFDLKESGLVEGNGDRIVHDWFSVEDWSQKRLGIFADTGPNPISQEQRTHLRMALDHARRFRSEIIYKESIPYPQIAVLASDSSPTLSSVRRNGSRSSKGWDFVSNPMKPGDNRVEFARAVPPAGTRCSVFKTSRAHDDLLNDTRQVEAILKQLAGS